MSYLLKTKLSKIIGAAVTVLLFLFAFLSSLYFGQTAIVVEDIVQAFTRFNTSSINQVVVLEERLPRAVLGSVIGASLAIAGALMQALTGNPLASPSIFGINAGALFFVVLSITLFSFSSLVQIMWLALLGAAVAGLLVFLLGSIGRDGMTPIKVVLAGSAISALFLSMTQAMLVLDENGLQQVLFWLTGSISGRSLGMLYPILPFIVIAAAGAMFMGNALNVFATGEDVAKNLGQKTTLFKIGIGLIVIILAGSSVSIAGAIGFIGLVVPHITRGMFGPDYRWVIPLSAVLGASLLVSADVLARLLIMPQEIPVGIMTALIGTPFFIYIARYGLTKR
ncbi:siderophore ABC transporter permease [Halobacillus andaensis]|uniref:Siderophore ABC transporter permease n=1 Tax=Halobacillus andaensis TaxID=1176239 RepID=A0A917B825_HALAA|nr:iron ABC transporter permease [Halobacillus andaensis]MBP2005162.1 iron complex transport system permease protein [Halobacillus andaensis]GGF29315.1 siderophore ABC transporter permease [Halobacillus andaensis]